MQNNSQNEPVPTPQDTAVSSRLQTLETENGHIPPQPPIQPARSPFKPPVDDQPKKSRRWVTGALIAVLVAIVGCVAFYWLVMRTPDSEYQKASALIDAMSTNAKKTADFGRSITNKGVNQIASKDIENAQAEINQYASSLATLQNSPVIQRDIAVKAVYDSNKKRIEDYATSTKAMLTTLYVYSNSLSRCTNFLQQLEKNVTTVAQFDSAVKDCQNFTQTHATVPLKDFNDNLYVTYRAGVLDYLNAARSYFVAVEAKDQKAADTAVANITNALRNLKQAASDKHPSIINTQNPGAQLTTLNQIVKDRQSVPIR